MAEFSDANSGNPHNGSVGLPCYSNAARYRDTAFEKRASSLFINESLAETYSQKVFDLICVRDKRAGNAEVL